MLEIIERPVKLRIDNKCTRWINISPLVAYLYRCKAPAVKGWLVCRMHGARGGAPSGPANGRWRHGNRTRDAEAMRRALSELMAEARMTAHAVYLCGVRTAVQKFATEVAGQPSLCPAHKGD